eukprot:TRINITY_DN1287_c0_g3_i1.p1 TRINITY_DN1287_c0_g3~~TRINITY_DN1287_c0_g3_i1.p1  ORF type:complete len:351 (+),score=111.85 TRINITY_DN1287_c0_g3_i1:936-1988(+)
MGWSPCTLRWYQRRVHGVKRYLDNMHPVAPSMSMLLLLLCVYSVCTHAFITAPLRQQQPRYYHASSTRMAVSGENNQLQRRELLSTAAAVVVTTAAVATGQPQSAAAEEFTISPAKPNTKVVVLGGTGFVGSEVCAALAKAGVSVTSVSRSGKAVEGATSVRGDPSTDDLTATLKGAAAVISCIGVIGTDDDILEAGNGAVNVAAVKQAAAAGVPRFVYVGVASSVPAALASLALKGYFRGKAAAESAVLSTFGANAAVIKPSFIYGGAAFGVAPPRVPQGYGSFVAAALSAPPLRALAGAAPGIVGVALTPPVSVESVAYACAAAALGRAGGVVDGTDAINAAARSASA